MSQNKKSPYKAFCKVCQDAGKPESVYTSHNVRQTQDKNSQVLCPTLLAQECRYCHKSGHSIKYCPIIKDQEKQRNQNQQKPETKKSETKKPETKPTSKNIYMIFEDEEDEEKEQTKPIMAPAPVDVNRLPAPMSFASIIQKAAVIERKEILALAAKEAEKEKKIQSQIQSQIQKKKFNWADCDSEDEAEYYNEISDEE